MVISTHGFTPALNVSVTSRGPSSVMTESPAQISSIGFSVPFHITISVPLAQQYWFDMKASQSFGSLQCAN